MKNKISIFLRYCFICGSRTKSCIKTDRYQIDRGKFSKSYKKYNCKKCDISVIRNFEDQGVNKQYFGRGRNWFYVSSSDYQFARRINEQDDKYIVKIKNLEIDASGTLPEMFNILKRLFINRNLY